MLHASLPSEKVFVVPNALDASAFTPDPSQRPVARRCIVVLCRLTYRKGIDLLVRLIPLVCAKHPEADWVIGGDGPKREDLDRMVETHGLQDRVRFLGAVRTCDVRDVLVQGHVFVNTSLTESFCIAILEAAACGLSVASTDVGGIPEVLPP